MKKLKRTYLMAAVALLTAGCSEQDAINQQGRTPVNLGYTVVESQTRAATNLNENYLSSGTLMVSVKTHGAADYPTFVAYTGADDGALTPPSEGQFYYPGGTTADIVACYPSETFTAVETDQTTDAAYLASDLMWAAVENQQATTHTVNLQLRHLMSKIVVNATAGEGLSGINSVKLVNVKPGIASFDPATGTVGDATGDAGAITMTNNGAALIPKQTIDGAFIEIATDLGIATYAVDNKAFLSGYQYTFNITVNYYAVGTTNTIEAWNEDGSITIQPEIKNPSVLDNRAPAGVEAVDLGIVVDGKKVLFANMNLGATSETDYGLYFAWGETTGYGSDPSDGRSFDWANYKWGDGTSSAVFSKYCPSSATDYLAAGFSGDTKTVLDYSDDAARVNWGGDWRMPTKAEMQALCALTKVWMSDYNSTGVAGYTFTGNGNTIFLPAAGCRSSTDEVYDLGSYSFYRSSTLDGDNPKNAWFMDFRDYYANMSSVGRYYGGTVRPVMATTNKGFATLTCSTDALNFTSSQNTGATLTKTGVYCSGGTISVSSSNTSNCTVTYSNGTITVTRATTAAFTNTVITVTVTPDDNHIAPSNVMFNVSAAQPYPMASSATASDKGSLICALGHIHAYGADAGCTAVRYAMIAYVGSATGESSYTHGLAISLVDCGGSASANGSTYMYNSPGHSYLQTSSSFSPESGLQYRNSTHDSSTYPAFQAAFSNNGATRPTGCSDWFLPTGYQWNQMMSSSGMGSYTNLRDAFSSRGGRNMVSNAYWSSTEYSASNAWGCKFTSGNWDHIISGFYWASNYAPAANGYVRSVLAF